MRSWLGDDIAMSNPIRAFWNWFADHLQSAEAAYDSTDCRWLDENLTGRLRSIEARLNWEIGPYHHPDRTLVISPSARENLQLARQVAAAAPAFPRWHILPAKPAKVLNRLALELPNRKDAQVDATNWTYRLTAFNKLEFFDVEIFTDVATSIAEKDLLLLTHRLIESMLGEEWYLERIAAVKVHRAIEPPPDGRMTEFRLLAKHIAHLLGNT